MPTLPQFLVDAFTARLGSKAPQYLEASSVGGNDPTRSHIAGRMASFSVSGKPMPLAVADISQIPLFDLGHASPSQSVLVAVLESNANPAVLQRATKALRRKITPTGTVLVFSSVRFVDFLQSAGRTGAAIGYAESVDVIHSDGKRLWAVHIVRGGTHVTVRGVDVAAKKTTPKAVAKAIGALPDRATLSRFVPLTVGGIRQNGSRVNVPIVGTEHSPLVDRYAIVGAIQGVEYRQATLQKQVRFVLDAADAGAGTSVVASVTGYNTQKRALEMGGLGPGQSARNMQYGDPRDCGRRSGRELCLTCCDTQDNSNIALGGGLGLAAGTAAGTGLAAAGAFGSATASATTATGLGIGASVGAAGGPAAAITIPVAAAIGAVVGLIFGLFTAVVFSESCYSKCWRLYPVAAYVGRSFLVDRVTKDPVDGYITGVAGLDSVGEPWALNRDQAVRARIPMFVDRDGQRVAVRVGRLEGRLYLRTRGDTSLRNNLEALPDAGRLPHVTGLGLV